MEAEAEAEGGGWGCVEEGLESGNGKEGRNGWAGLDSLAWLQRDLCYESFSCMSLQKFVIFFTCHRKSLVNFSVIA